MEHKVLDPGTKVRVFAQRIEHHERTRSGWIVREEIRLERFGVIEAFMVEQNYPFYRVKFPDGSEDSIYPTQLEPYECDLYNSETLT